VILARRGIRSGEAIDIAEVATVVLPIFSK
jgi:hypothetical protein